MKLWKAILWAYGLVLLFTIKLPMGVEFVAFIQWGLILAGVIWLVANYGKKLLDSTKSFSLGVLVAFVWAVFVQVVLGAMSGISLGPVEQAWRSSSGLVGILKDPNAISSILVKQGLILVVIVISLWIYKNSERKKWMTVSTLIAALFGLMYYANTGFNLYVNSLFDKGSAWTLDNTHKNNCDVWLQTELQKGPVGLYVAKKKALYQVNDSKAEVKRTLEVGTFLYVEKSQDGKKIIVDGIKLYKVFIYDDISGVKEEGYITIIGLSSDEPQCEVADTRKPQPPQPQVLTKLIILNKGQGWVKTGLVPMGSAPIFYEILSPTECVASDFLVRIGQYGSTARGEPFNSNTKLLRVWAVDGNPGGYQGELQLTNSAFSEVVVRVATNICSG